MTVAVAARLGLENSRWHWGIRDEAASLLGFICSRYGSVHEGISTRAAKTLVKAFQVDPKIKGLQCQYGTARPPSTIFGRRGEGEVDEGRWRRKTQGPIGCEEQGSIVLNDNDSGGEVELEMTDIILILMMIILVISVIIVHQ
jgi:hypothetical protein